MERIADILPKGTWQRGDAADVVRLGYDERLRRRRRYETAGGRSVLLDLPELTLLMDGDGLKLASGDILAVEAVAEDLLEVTGAPTFLARLAWHLGNRHVAVEIGPGTLRLREDTVMADLLARLGAEVRAVAAPFNPEGGAYGALGHTAHQDHKHEMSA